MSIFLKAIGAGFSSKSILNRLSKMSPKYADAIRIASDARYLSHTILKKLDKHGAKHDSSEYLTAWEKGRRSDEENRNKAKKQLGTAASALGAAGLIGAGLLNSGSQSGSDKLIDQNPPSTTIDVTPNTPPGKPPIQPGSAFSMSPEQKDIIDKVPSAKDVELIGSEPFKDLVRPSQSIKSEFPQLQEFIDKSLQAGKTPEETYENLKKSRFLSPLVHRIEQKEGKSFLENIKGKDTSIPVEPLKVGSEMLSPFGAGSIEHIKGDKAVINVDGKKRSIPVDELEPPSEDAIEAVTKMLNIPESDRSSNVSLFFYDPEVSDLFVQFHSGDFYRYKDLPKEIVENLASKNAIPLTKGENIYGEWSPDDKESLGAALYRYVLQDPKWKRAAKGQEANSMYKKLSPLYDYWKPLRKKGRK